MTARFDAEALPRSPRDEAFDPTKIVRPAPVLLWYYVTIAVLTGPLCPFVFLPLFFKYETLRYRFDAGGLSMSWGLLFRKEVFLTYRRIQDIHLTRNIIQRWMGLATVSIQTASGTSRAEMAIEGILEAEPLRDYLYGKMRGIHEEHAGAQGERPAGESAAPGEVPPAAGDDDSLRLLREIRDLLAHMASRRAENA